MADYVNIDTVRSAGGLRLVLTAGVPGAPWTESAKAVFEVKKVPTSPAELLTDWGLHS